MYINKEKLIKVKFLPYLGSVWEIYAIAISDQNRGRKIPIGKILFESQEPGFNRLGTFDEMLGCNKCNAIYHKDTRYGPIVGADDGSKRKPVSMYGKTRHDESTCKTYFISGSKDDSSISFESGPLTKNRSTTKFKVW